MAKTKARSRGRKRKAEPAEVLDLAARVLAAEGSAALTMRRLAKEVGASTQVLYTLFESKEGVIDALVEEGFRRFGDALGRVDEADPFVHLHALGVAYRRFALENADYYALLWDPATCPSPAQKPRGGDTAWLALVRAVTRVLAELDRPARDIEPTAMALWSAMHGFCSLEIVGVAGGEPQFTALMNMTVHGIRGPRAGAG